jgi:hypothetical protein
MEHPWSINNCGGDSASYTAMECIQLVLNWVLHGRSVRYVLVYNFTNLHAMFHRSDFFGSSSSVNSSEPTFCFTIPWISTVSQVKIRRFLIPTTTLDSNSLTTSLLPVIISSKTESVCMRDFRDLTSQLIFDAYWASMNVRSKFPSASNNSRQATSWWLYLHFEIDETGSPGLIRIVCHQVLYHPSEHETSSMGIPLLAKLTSQS